MHGQPRFWPSLQTQNDIKLPVTCTSLRKTSVKTWHPATYSTQNIDARQWPSFKPTISPKTPQKCKHLHCILKTAKLQVISNISKIYCSCNYCFKYVIKISTKTLCIAACWSDLARALCDRFTNRLSHDLTIATIVIFVRVAPSFERFLPT